MKQQQHRPCALRQRSSSDSRRTSSSSACCSTAFTPSLYNTPLSTQLAHRHHRHRHQLRQQSRHWPRALPRKTLWQSTATRRVTRRPCLLPRRRHSSTHTTRIPKSASCVCSLTCTTASAARRATLSSCSRRSESQPRISRSRPWWPTTAQPPQAPPLPLQPRRRSLPPPRQAEPEAP